MRLPILMYHRIDRVTARLPGITRGLTVTPQAFARQMRFLAVHRYHPVTQEQVFAALEQDRPLPPRPVLITFDDGYADILRNAAPVLARLHFPATAYIISGRIGGPDSSFLTWHGVRALERDGIEIGSHTVHHVPLTALSDKQALDELVHSRAALQAALGHPVQWFAYPFGKVDPRVADLVRRAGYVLAVTTEGGTAQQTADPLLLHRDEVLDTTTLRSFAGFVGGRSQR